MVSIIITADPANLKASSSSPVISTTPMASTPLVSNTAKQLTILLIITITTLSTILWLTELDTIHCSSDLFNNHRLISAFTASMDSSNYLAYNSSLVKFSRSAFQKSFQSSLARSTIFMDSSFPFLLISILSFSISGLCLNGI